MGKLFFLDCYVIVSRLANLLLNSTDETFDSSNEAMFKHNELTPSSDGKTFFGDCYVIVLCLANLFLNSTDETVNLSNEAMFKHNGLTPSSDGKTFFPGLLCHSVTSG